MIGMPLEEAQYGLDIAGLDPASLGDAVKAVMNDVLSDPMRLTMWMSRNAINEQTIALNFLRRLAGENVEGNAQAASTDKRFSDPAWRSNPMLAGMVEAYLTRAKASLECIEESRVDPQVKRKARFAVGMMLDALAPSNVPWINPAVVKEAMNTGGASLVAGLQNFLDDVRTNGGRPRQVDRSPFVLGKNIACTPGRVVYRNELIELLAYEPQTATVFEQPILFSPPWINKYYIMDLAPNRSYAEWAVKNGFTVFCISYRNPDASLAQLTMGDYLRLGVLDALDVMRSITGAPVINIAALCLGGTMAAIALAYLAAHGGDSDVGWCTMTNALVDFSEPGDLGVFTDEPAVRALEERMRSRGYLESAQMSSTFDWLRGNDLVWNYVVTNWYMGKKPPAFDILAWNADGTRMPATMHSQYLRSCYLQNQLAKPGAFRVLDTPIDMSLVRTPLYILAAETDHIAPWRTVYNTTQLVGGDARFVLTSSGHIAGIVNPPGNDKASYWEQTVAAKGTPPDAWRAGAVQHRGSWWEDWGAWASQRSGKRVAPPNLPKGDPAPGSYVRNETAEPYDPRARGASSAGAQ